jgi:hypothetical protein
MGLWDEISTHDSCKFCFCVLSQIIKMFTKFTFLFNDLSINSEEQIWRGAGVGWHRHISLKLFWPQPMTPWTTDGEKISEHPHKMQCTCILNLTVHFLLLLHQSSSLFIWLQEESESSTITDIRTRQKDYDFFTSEHKIPSSSQCFFSIFLMYYHHSKRWKFIEEFLQYNCSFCCKDDPIRLQLMKAKVLAESSLFSFFTRLFLLQRCLQTWVS